MPNINPGTIQKIISPKLQSLRPAGKNQGSLLSLSIHLLEIIEQMKKGKIMM
jgi:hypothetical protein